MLDVAVDLAALGDEGVLHNGALADLLGGQHGVAAVDLPLLVEDINAGVLGVQHFHVGFPQAVDGAHVAPVTGKAVGVHLAAVTQQGGDDVHAEVVLGVGVSLVLDQILLEHIPVEDVDAHGGQIGLGHRGLLLELGDAVGLVRHHQAEAGSFLPVHFHNGHRELCALFLVEAQEVGVVLLADLVTGQDDDVLGIIAVDEADVLIDGVCSALVPVGAVCLLVRGQGVHTAVQTVQIPRLTVTDVLVQLLGLVLCCDTDGVDIGVDAVGQREVHDAVLTAEGHRRFCRLLCQRV